MAGCPRPSQNGVTATASDGTSANTAASSVVVELADGIVGTLVLPGSAGPHPAVLMLHGFGSSRDEVGEMFVRTARALSEEGIASLRIDFRGSGASRGDFRDTTIDGQLRDAERALAWLRTHDAISPDRIGLLGFSLGGAIAVLTAGRHADEIASLVVWSTVVDLHADFLATLGQETFDRALDHGSATRDLGWRTVTLRRAFFESLHGHDIERALIRYNGPFMAIAGTEDPLARYARPLAELVDGMAVFVRGASHIFNALNQGQDQVETVIQTTTVRFVGTLLW